MNSLFQYKITHRIEFDDLDAFKVVHNSTYFRFFERGRIEYLRHVGLIPDKEQGFKNIEVAVVENFCSYRKPAQFDDVIAINLRISYIKKSSLQFQYLIEKDSDGVLIAYGYSNLINVSDPHFKATQFEPEYLRAIETFEGDNLGKMTGIPNVKNNINH